MTQAPSSSNNVNTIEDIFSIATPILKKFNVSAAYLFGSFAKGSHSHASDVDILVEFTPEVEKKLTIMTLVELKSELEEALGRNVDIVQERFILHPIVRASIQQSKLLIFNT